MTTSSCNDSNKFCSSYDNNNDDNTSNANTLLLTSSSTSRHFYFNQEENLTKDDENETTTNQGNRLLTSLFLNKKKQPPLLSFNTSIEYNEASNKCKNVSYATLSSRLTENIKPHYHYNPVGTFLTQYKIRENYKFLQMISVPSLDPQVPKPESGTSVPAYGEPLVVPASFPQSIEAAIHKFANASSKTTCISVLDQAGKPISSLTYGNFISKFNENQQKITN